ncbi:bifunctional non-homologous end joining protein LigD [Novimethylophilus kurashikiensis]|uniref:DNA ligase (ATP) n=1 Tax=Novimethylophilus kurashikiensis TaxID=1825523 RepID=A0A2R5F5G7_9PROT|nr:DNA ligase D [Novimethylophilus kurashikiensis]GBG13582.1 bifunctional non-homologous end joining protein LigD [Novimethylophilus kurashikiensis]
MGLEKYWQKRDFKITPEPHGKVVRPGRELHYFIQEHHATRLHYDFRLELEGTLKSWAVPKGPSLDPADKRLAVHVEDHPLDYGTFEGVIPEHQYGAGHVKLWDRGVWEPEGDPVKGYKQGRLKFHLDGHKLHGGWTLVRIHGQEKDKENWLLIKEHDEEARNGEAAHITELRPESVSEHPVPMVEKPKSKAKRRVIADAKPVAESEVDPSAVNGAEATPMPDPIKPQLATLAEQAPEGEQWLSEVKFDGYRALTRIDQGEVQIYTRAGNDWTGKWPSLADVLKSFPVKQAWIDGEVVALDAEGKVSFQALQNKMRLGKSAQLAYYVFDLVYLDGYELAAVPLAERKRLLKKLMEGMPQDGPILYSDHIVGNAHDVFEHACMHGLEGIVAKRADAGYQQTRGRSWLKVKCKRRQEFVVGGYTDPGGSREAFGALLVGVNEGDGLRYCGKVGTGFDAKRLKTVAGNFTKLEQDRAPFSNPPKGAEARGVHWLRPELVAEVEFAEWTEGGHIRHASFVGLRGDKPAREIMRERPISEKEVERATKDTPTVKPKAAAKAAESRLAKPGKTNLEGIEISNPSKVLFPRIGLTKLGLAEYYEAVGEWIVPHLKNRPLTLVRCPQGGEHKCFFQKHVNETIPEAIKPIEVPEEEGPATYMMANDVAAVIGLVQMGVLELHTWGSSKGHLDKPDRMIFDLDPAEDLPWENVVEGAQLVHGLLDEIGLASFLKTTGGKGLHIVVPLKPERTWDEVKPFSKAIAEHLANMLPERFTSNMSKAKRGGRIFIDYLRNGQGATAVAAYSTRAKPEATVSMPIFWDELGEGLRADTFNTRNAVERLKKLHEDPWKDYFTLKQRITADMLKIFK